MRFQESVVADDSNISRVLEITLGATRSRIHDVSIGRPALIERGFNSDGAVVWAIAPSEGLDSAGKWDVVIDYEGEPPRIAERRFHAGGLARVTREWIAPDLVGERVREWFKNQLDTINARPESEHRKSARRFFLELDRVSLRRVLRHTIGDELNAKDLNMHEEFISRVEHKLFERIIHRMATGFPSGDLSSESAKWLNSLYRSTLKKSGLGKHPHPARLLEAFRDFSLGHFRIPNSPHSDGEPSSGYFFYFAETILILASQPDGVISERSRREWRRCLGAVVQCQRLFYLQRKHPTDFGKPGPIDPNLVAGLDVKAELSGWDDDRTLAEWSSKIGQHTRAAFFPLP